MISGRIRSIENRLAREMGPAMPPGNEDHFLDAIGVSPSDYEEKGGGYDFLRALSDCATVDWNDEQ